MSLTFPWTVGALGWGTKKEEKGALPLYDDPNCMEAKLFNKNDQKLIEDLKAADKIYSEGDGLTHKQIYDRLVTHKVSLYRESRRCLKL